MATSLCEGRAGATIRAFSAADDGNIVRAAGASRLAMQFLPCVSGSSFEESDRVPVGRDLSGEVTVQTGDGSIRLDNVNGPLDVATGDGSIAAAGQFTSVRARSGDGSVTIHAATGSAPSTDSDIKTGDGSVTVELPADFNGELDAHTGDGRIRLQDVAVSDVSGELVRGTARGRIGSGGHALRVRTGDGSITLRRF